MDQLKEDPDKIEKTVRMVQKFCQLPEMQALKEENFSKYRMEMEKIFPHFSGWYPFLFKKVIRGDELSQLDEFLKVMRGIKDGTMDKYTEEVRMGADLANEHFPENLKEELRNQKR